MKSKPNIYLYLSGMEKAKLMSLLFSADNKRDEYIEKLEVVRKYLEGLKSKYEELCKENEKYKETYDVISEILERFNYLEFLIPSPYNIVSAPKDKRS